MTNTQFGYGVRVAARTPGENNAWVQTGFTASQAEAEAERLTARNELESSIRYEAAAVRSMYGRS